MPVQQMVVVPRQRIADYQKHFPLLAAYPQALILSHNDNRCPQEISFRWADYFFRKLHFSATMIDGIRTKYAL